MSDKLKQVSQTLSNRETIAAVVWLVIGISQCLSFIFIISGAWNIYASISRFKQAKAVLNPWRGIVGNYDSWMKNIIINMIVNVIFGGVYGVLGSLYDLIFVRGYVLDNKNVYAEAGL